ncbi:hypothetical protein [Streptomyces sp. NPDC001719]
MKRCSQRRTVFSLQTSSQAIADTVSPAQFSSTILARIARSRGAFLALASRSTIARSPDLLSCRARKTIARHPTPETDLSSGHIPIERGIEHYAPELNPVELLWSAIKSRELANLAGDHLADVADATERGIHRVCSDEQLPWSFLTHTGLTIHPKPPQN